MSRLLLLSLCLVNLWMLSDGLCSVIGGIIVLMCELLVRCVLIIGEFLLMCWFSGVMMCLIVVSIVLLLVKIIGDFLIWLVCLM